MFPGINAPSRKLKLRFRVILMRQQQVLTYRQKRIHPRSALIQDIILYALTKATYHPYLPLLAGLPSGPRQGMAQIMKLGNSNVAQRRA